MGNVLATITDMKQGIENNSDGIAEYYEAQVRSAQLYYPFGWSMPGRQYSAADYRFGMNGQEKSPEISNGHTTALFWEYDSRIAKRWNLDPRPVTGISPYATFQGDPIKFADVLGDSVRNRYEKYKKYAGLEQTLKDNVKNAKTKQERKLARKELKDKGNRNKIIGYSNYKTVDELLKKFEILNKSEYQKLNNLTFEGKDIDIIVGLNFSGNFGSSGQLGDTRIAYKDFMYVTDFKTRATYKKPTSLDGNKIDVTLYGYGASVSVLANEFGDAIFAVEQPATLHNERNLPYLQQGTTIFSYKYSFSITGRKPVPKSKDYANPKYK